jgi:hypothetical protein
LLFRVEGSPEFIHPAYMVYARATDNTVTVQAPGQLRELV